MFRRVYLGLKAFKRILGGAPDPLLCQDRPVVDLFVDDVDGDSRLRHAGVPGVEYPVRAGKGRKQRRVDVYDPPLEAADEFRREYAHKAGEHDPVAGCLIDGLRDGLFGRRFAVAPVKKDPCGRSQRGSRRKPLGLQPVAADEGDLRGQLAGNGGL